MPASAVIGTAVAVVTVLGGWLLVDVALRAVVQANRPERVAPVHWECIIESVDEAAEGGYGAAGEFLGALERILYFIAFWHGAYVLIAAWLGFKVATKWQSWSNLLSNIDVPELPDFPHIEAVNRLRARRYLGWRLSQRFLIGTILNILICFLGVAGARAIIQLVG